MQAAGGVLIGGGIVGFIGCTVLKPPSGRFEALAAFRFFFAVGQCFSVASIAIGCHMSLDLPEVAHKVKQAIAN